MAQKSNTRTESLLDEIADAISFNLKPLGIAEQRALEIGAAVAEKIRKVFGGQMIYVPRGLAKMAAERDAELLAAFTGNNHAELASKFGISVVHAYRAIKRAQARNRG